MHSKCTRVHARTDNTDQARTTCKQEVVVIGRMTDLTVRYSDPRFPSETANWGHAS